MILADFVDPRIQHVLDVESGSVETRGFANMADRRYVGFGSWRRLDGFGRPKTFVAAYAASPTVMVRIGRETFDSLALGIFARVSPIDLFRRRFCMLDKTGRRVFEKAYPFLELRTWPDAGDIFILIERHTSSARAVVRWSVMMAAVQDGRDVIAESISGELDRAVDRLMSPQT